VATAIFGGLTPYLSQLLLHRTGWAPAPGLMIAIVAIAVLPVFLTMSETAPRRRSTAQAGPRPDIDR
jgi:MHS family proline/betaine transporter-like MFS transporter